MPLYEVTKAIDLGALVLSVGAIGTAAAGIVDSLKCSERIRSAGFSRIEATLGKDVLDAIASVYGEEGRRYLNALYLEERKKGSLTRALRQGLRLALKSENAAALATALGQPERASHLGDIAARIEHGDELDDADRATLGRFELAADARIEAALSLAANRYVSTMRLAASAVAIALSMLAAGTVGTLGADGKDVGFVGSIIANFVPALLMGVAAVPLAPIAKDFAAGISNARSALSTGAGAGTTRR